MVSLKVTLVVVGLVAAVSSDLIQVAKPGEEIVVDSSTGSVDLTSQNKAIHVANSGTSGVSSVQTSAVSVTKWGGCGWLGRPCYKIEILTPGRAPEVFASELFPSNIDITPARVSVTL